MLARYVLDLPDHNGTDCLDDARHQWQKILQAIGACAKDNDCNAIGRHVLLIAEISIHRDEDLEPSLAQSAEGVLSFACLPKPLAARWKQQTRPAHD